MEQWQRAAHWQGYLEQWFNWAPVFVYLSDSPPFLLWFSWYAQSSAGDIHATCVCAKSALCVCNHWWVLTSVSPLNCFWAYLWIIIVPDLLLPSITIFDLSFVQIFHTVIILMNAYIYFFIIVITIPSLPNLSPLAFLVIPSVRPHPPNPKLSFSFSSNKRKSIILCLEIWDLLVGIWRAMLD